MISGVGVGHADADALRPGPAAGGGPASRRLLSLSESGFRARARRSMSGPCDGARPLGRSFSGCSWRACSPATGCSSHAAGFPAERRYRPTARPDEVASGHFVRPMWPVPEGSQRRSSKRTRTCRAMLQSDEGGSLVIALKPPVAKRRLIRRQVDARIAQEARRHSGAKCHHRQSAQHQDRRPRVALQLPIYAQGLDLDQLRQASEHLVRALQADPVFIGVNSDLDAVGAVRSRSPSTATSAAAIGVTPAPDRERR